MAELTQTTAIIRELFLKGQPVTYAKNQVILGNSGEPDGVYFIASGFIKIYAISDEGDQFLHVIYGPNELFPLVWAYLGEQPEPLFYETISEASLWRISKDVLRENMMRDNTISLAIGTQLARQFWIYAARLDNLEYKKASERVAYRILFLASRFGTKTNGSIDINLPISHETFANSINLARESVSREIEKLEVAHIIEQNGRQHIVIKDVKALSKRLSQPPSFRSWHLLEDS